MTRAGQRVVFVGDDSTPLDALEAAFDVVVPEERAAVIDCLESTAIGCIVVDGTGTDRVATVAVAADAAPSVPVVYTTATPDGAAAAAATRAGATEYVIRTTEETLVERVAAVSTTSNSASAETTESTASANRPDRETIEAGTRTERNVGERRDGLDPDRESPIGIDPSGDGPNGRVSRTERDAILDRIHAIVSDDGPFDARLEALLSIGRTALGVEYGTLSRIDGNRYTFKYVSGVDDHITSGETFPLSEAYCQRIVDSGESLGFTAVTDQRPELTDRGAFREYGITCFLGVPVTVDGDLWGTLCFFARSDRSVSFSEWERTIVELLANWIGHELEDQSRQRELERVRTARERTLERLDDAVLTVDEDWRLTSVHGWAEELLGDDGAVGTSLWTALPDAIGSALETEYRCAMAEETPATLEEYVPSIERWLQLQLSPSETELSVSVTDVTDRHEREIELQRYETIVETIDDGVLVIDSDRRFVHVNDAFADLVGADRERLVGMHLSSLVAEAGRGDWISTAMSLATDGSSRETFEADLQRVDGGTVPIEANVTPLESTDPDDIAFVSVVRDVTDQQRRADVVTELLETTRALFSCETQADVAEIVVDAAERVLGFEIGTVRLYDPETEDLVLTAASDAVGELFDERKRVGIHESEMGEAFRTADPIIFEDVQRSSLFEYELIHGAMCIPIGDHGLLNVGSPVSGAFDDHHIQLAQLLTASAAAALERADRGEELLRHEQVLETVEGMVYAVDDDARLTLVTDPLAERLGYDREALIGEPVSRIFTDESYDRAVEHVENLLADPQRDSDAFEATYTTADGEQFPVEIEYSLLPRSEDDIASETFQGTVSVVRDITQRKEREQYLQVLNRVLRHNLRNDLTVVIGYAELLRERLDDPELAAAADTLRETATDLAGTSEKTRAIQHALDRDSDLQPVDVAATAEEAVTETETEDATVSVSTDGDCWAWADSGLRLVIENLLENAIQYGGSTPIVDVSVSRDGERVELAVADDGPGIPPAETAVVTGETDITQLTHSSGLGLWLVRWMVDSYGGSISFATSALGGSRIEIGLEAAPSPSTDAE
ncbi:PAS domain S-box protein [Natrinema sp. SYSU A 869]|uniref:PAS domain S-box protein n=1 Tax=Natrinema sp. SYSU A 869 TaxID=2871694 RepID=UPI001CA3CA18|nr:PAS domain S-box protein [Natrinema sp. SYSU A 869]